MGYMSATAMAGSDVSPELVLTWHLQHNHYPPLPASMVEVCMEAIDLAEVGGWLELLPLPEHIYYRAEKWAPVWVIVETHHLEPFIGVWEDDES